MDLVCIALRVTVTCIVFAYVVFNPLKSRYKRSVLQTWLLISLLMELAVKKGA